VVKATIKGLLELKDVGAVSKIRDLPINRIR
jgi:hypothetical protein